MKISAAVLCGMLATGCVQEDPQDGRRVTGVQSEAVTVRCEVTAGTPTRSSIDADEDALEDINLYAYCDGKLEAMLYTQSPEDIRIKLYKGRTYNMYALANMGEVEAPICEEDMKDHRYSVGSLREIEGAFPMAWMKEGFTIEGSSPSLGISLERLLARISFSIERSELDDFQVTAIKLRQGALGVYPFREESRAESASDVADGDWASASDLSTLNAGGEIAFYALENRQGVLMPGNSDPCSKTPDGIPDNSELCTYLEMTSSYSGHYQGVTVSSDKVTYRFYLGEDNCTDFNVIRNKDVKINLKVTEDRIFDESWRVSYGEDLPNIAYGLTNSKSSVSLNVGGSTTLSATYYRTVDGVKDTETDVTSYAAWTSSNSSVATVSGGKITGVAEGTATITATYNGYSATATVTVEEDITYDYQLSPTSTNVVNGRTTKMTVIRRTFTNGSQTNGEDYSSNFTWTSSNTSVATVGSYGVITGVGTGTATITAKYGGTTLTGTVTVTPNYTYELVLNKTSIDMGKGRTETLVATYKTYADGVLESSNDVTSSATWSSSSSSVAGVSGGTITGNGIGSATITATYKGKSATCSVKVTGSPTLSLGWTSVNLKRGDVRTNAAIYNPNNGTASTNVTSSAVWTTSNSGVATVGGGQITAQGKGTCTITATYNGVSASCTVNVTENDTPSTNTYVSNMSVQSVNISGTNDYKLTLSLKFSDGTLVEDAPYTWSVISAQNTSIATGTSGDGPIVYTGGGSAYVMAVTLTTKAYYYDEKGNKRQHTIGTSFSHSAEWKP